MIMTDCPFCKIQLKDIEPKTFVPLSVRGPRVPVTYTKQCARCHLLFPENNATQD